MTDDRHGNGGGEMRSNAGTAWLLIQIGAVVCGARTPAAAADPAGDRSDPFKIWDARLTIAVDEYAAMQPRGGWAFGAAPKPASTPPLDPGRDTHRNTFGVDLPWCTGTVAVGGDSFAGVGVRYKGNGTIGDASRSVKKSFKIDLDRFGGSGRFLGSRTINLHSGVADPSKYREAFGYAIYRAAGVVAPRTSFAEVRLTVPGRHADELLGLYTVTEEVDKPFLRDRFGTDAGLLMKPEGVREIEDRGDNWDRYKKSYAPKRDATPAEARRVIAFARLVHKADDATFRREIESYLDVDGYLRFLAATSFVANPDSFFVLGHNYCIYLHPRTDRLHFFPWDLDRAFANLPIIGSAAQQMKLSLAHPYAGSHRLTDRLLAVPGMEERYRALWKELATTCFARERLVEELDAFDAAMKDALARDAKAEESRKVGKTGQPSGWFFGKPPGLRTFVDRRAASVEAQLAGRSKGHVPSGGFGREKLKLGDMLAAPMFDNLDADEDGAVSRGEWLAITKRLFAVSGKDSEGRVDPKGLAAGLGEMLPKPPEGPPPPPGPGLNSQMAGPIVARADADKDGKLTADELTAAAGRLFDEADRAKAGKLDAIEFGDLLGGLFPDPVFGAPAGKPGDAKGGR